MATVTRNEHPHLPDPVVRQAPEKSVGFRLRIELNDTAPPVWRTLEVPGQIHLDTLHALLQAAMGWSDSHLHQFRQGHDPGSPAFLTDFDLAEGEHGTPEAGIRLEQVLAEPGDELGYLYDFGDNWAHTITVEELLPTPPEYPNCLQGERACPPEDVGGAGAFEKVSEWVRAGTQTDPEQTVFDVDLMRDWLDPAWHPDSFSVDQATRAMQDTWIRHVRVAPELSQLLAGLPTLSGVIATEILEDEAWYLHRPGECLPTPAMLAPFITFLNVIGEGAKLTASKRLPPVVVRQYAEASGIADWWPRALSSEANVQPVAEVHETARGLGLVYSRKGKLLPTARAQQLGEDPASWVRHLSQKLPLGRTEFDRHAGWATLLVAGADTEFEFWDEVIVNTLADMGWRGVMGGMELAPAPQNPTKDFLEMLVRGLDQAYLVFPETAPNEVTLENNRCAVAALARQVVLQRRQV